MSAPMGENGLDNSGDSGNLESGPPSEEQQATGQQAPDQAFQQASEPSQAHGTEGNEGPSSEQQADNTRPNPAWNGLLEKVPEQFHTIIAPTLKDWDRNYNNLAQQHAPWKQFEKQGISPEALQRAYQIFQTIEMNPQEVYRRLGEHLQGQVPQSESKPTKKQKAPKQENDEYYEDDDDDEETDSSRSSEYEELKRKYDELQNTVQGDIQSRQEAEMTRQYEQEIDNTLNKLEQEHGKFDKQDVMRRVAAQLQVGQEPDINAAYQEQQQFIQQYIQQQAPNAPKVMPTNGGMPPNSETQDLSTKSGRRAKFEELMRAANSG